MKPLQIIVNMAWSVMDSADKDMLLDIIEKLLLEKQAEQPKKSRAIALGAINMLRSIAGIPDDDTDQLNPI